MNISIKPSGNLAQYYAKKIRKMNVFSSILYAGKANINEINQFKPNGILICRNQPY